MMSHPDELSYTCVTAHITTSTSQQAGRKKKQWNKRNAGKRTEYVFMNRVTHSIMALWIAVPTVSRHREWRLSLYHGIMSRDPHNIMASWIANPMASWHHDSRCTWYHRPIFFFFLYFYIHLTPHSPNSMAGGSIRTPTWGANYVQRQRNQRNQSHFWRTSTCPHLRHSIPTHREAPSQLWPY